MSKLRNTVQEVSICLRCQYRLSKRQCPREELRVSPGPRQRRHFASGRRQQQEQAPLAHPDDNESVIVKPIITYEPHDYPIRKPSRNSNRFSSTRTSLGFSTLGKPTEVLVVQDRGRRNEQDAINIGAQSSSSVTDAIARESGSKGLLEEMAAERGIIDIAQVCKNIDALKDDYKKKASLPQDSGGSTVSTEAFKDIEAQLRKGFTVQQLAAYLRRHTGFYMKDPLYLHEEYSDELYARSAWTLGTTDLWRVRAPDIRRAGEASRPHSSEKPSKSLMQKGAIVGEILRQCWKVRPEEIQGSLGEMDIRLQAAHLQLIMNHKRAILKQISETYGAKVEASSQDHIIRISSDYETSLDIFKLIIHTIRSIESSSIEVPSEFNVDPRGQNEAHGTVLEQAMQSTNTVILKQSQHTLQEEKHCVQVYYFGPEKEDFDDAQRLINQVLRPKVPRDRSVPFSKESSVLAIPHIRPSKDVLTPIDVGRGLSLANRSHQWSRWCNASIRSFTPNSDQIIAKTPLKTLIDPLNQKEVARAVSSFYLIPNEPYEVAVDTRAEWMSNKTYWDYALLGQVLFSTPHAENPKSVRPKLKQERREFASLVPGLVNALEHFGTENLDTTGWQEECLLIRLTPSFKNAVPFPLQVLPDLEIRVFFDESAKTTSIRDVRLSYQNTLDLLLPSNTMDLRFMRRTCVYSRKKGLDLNIRDFLDKSHLAIWSTEKLQTPPNLTLNVPPHSLRPLNDGRKLDNSGYNIVYDFANLEHKSEIGLPFRQPGSWADLTYTSIEAGKFGGRRDELYLRQPRVSKTRPTPDDNDHNIKIDDTNEDEKHSASLLRKANALIKIIEHPPDHVTSQKLQGLGKMQDLDTAEQRRAMSRMKQGRLRSIGVRGIPIREVTGKAKIRKTFA